MAACSKHDGIAARVVKGSALIMLACIAGAGRAAVPNLPSRLTCTYDASPSGPAYDVVIAFDEKTGKIYTSRGGKIASGTITAGEISILHIVRLPGGERELTTTTINRRTGKIVLAREGGGVLESGSCVKMAD